MTRLIAAGRLGPGMPSLEDQLELSLAVAEGRVRLLRAEDLPDELTLNTTHAILSRIIREGQDKAKLR